MMPADRAAAINAAADALVAGVLAAVSPAAAGTSKTLLSRDERATCLAVASRLTKLARGGRGDG